MFIVQCRKALLLRFVMDWILCVKIILQPKIIRAGKANMFLSDVFIDAFVNVTNTPVELYENDGSVGAALGAGIGAKIFADEKEAFKNMKRLKIIEPNVNNEYDVYYEKWKEYLMKKLN